MSYLLTKQTKGNNMKATTKHNIYGAIVIIVMLCAGSIG